jgi:hypothetical protein
VPSKRRPTFKAASRSRRDPLRCGPLRAVLVPLLRLLTIVIRAVIVFIAEFEIVPPICRRGQICRPPHTLRPVPRVQARMHGSFASAIENTIREQWITPKRAPEPCNGCKGGSALSLAAAPVLNIGPDTAVKIWGRRPAENSQKKPDPGRVRARCANHQFQFRKYSKLERFVKRAGVGQLAVVGRAQTIPLSGSAYGRVTKLGPDCRKCDSHDRRCYHGAVPAKAGTRMPRLIERTRHPATTVTAETAIVGYPRAGTNSER